MMDDVEHVRRPQSDVMQPRTDTVGEGDVVHIALAMHPHRPELGVGAVGLGVFGEPEAELAIEIVARLHVRREAVEMVDALDARALMVAVLLQHAFRLIHLRIEIERHAEHIRVRKVRPWCGKSGNEVGRLRRPNQNAARSRSSSLASLKPSARTSASRERRSTIE